MNNDEMICLDCGYKAQCWDMNYSNKRECTICPDCDGENVEFSNNIFDNNKE
jgi:hypothetical protein